MAQAPPKAGAKELLYSLQSKYDPSVYMSVSMKVFFCRFAKESLPTEIGKGRHWTSVFFLWSRSNTPRFAQGQPNGYFQMKELDRTTEPIARMNVEWMLEKAEFAEFNMPTCGKIASLTAVQRKTAFVEESWWPEFNLFGSMPWCSLPWHKHLPRLKQKDCYTVYSLNWIHEFTSLFSTNLLYVGWPRKALPRK